jgi:hypothetical protein
MMSESRLYLYRKAGREVWDAEMWLPDGRRRVWRTGIADKGAATAAAQARLKALAAVQTVAPIGGGCMVNECAPVVSPSADARDAALLLEQADVPSCAAVKAQACAATDAPASAGGSPHAQAAGAEPDVALVSEEQAQAFQTPGKAQEMGALGRFDRWFFGDLASLWRARA